MIFDREKFAEGQLEWLREETKLSEKIDYACNFITCRDENRKIIAIAGVNFVKLPIPRFEHIIITPRYQRTRLGVVMMRRVEKYIKDAGHKGYVAFILHPNKLMHNYAKKWGMRAYQITNKGTWFEKRIGGENEIAE